MIDGATSQPFSAITLPQPERKTSHKEEVIELSRERYARERKEVEREILFRSSYCSNYSKAGYNRRLPI
jgi:hypothetical protein